MKKFKNWLKQESGATAIEYSLIAAAIALAIMVVVVALGGKVSVLYTSVTAIF